MQIKDVRPEWYTKQIRCDRCGLLFVHGDAEFHEAVSIELTAGYGSVFGDGKVVQIDLCQHCLQLTLGPWLRIAETRQDMQVIDQSSDIFCSKRAVEDAESKEELAKQWSNPEGELADASTSATLAQLANDVFASEAGAWNWLNTPHPMLEDKTPLQTARTASGADRVKDILVTIKYGGVL